MSDSYLVLLRCGHWYREARPQHMAAPTQGEFRTCVKLQHYPEKYEAFYLHMQPKVVEAWYERREYETPTIVAGIGWESAFDVWWTAQGHSPEQSEGRRLAAEAWKAALNSIFPEPTTGAGPLA